MGCKMCVKAEENSLGQYIRYHIEPLIVAIRISNTMPSENSRQPKEFKPYKNEERLKSGEGKQCMCNTLDKQKTRTRATHESG